MVTEKLNVPAALGVPDKVPPALSVNPVGAVPAVTANVYGVLPPLPANAWL